MAISSARVWTWVGAGLVALTVGCGVVGYYLWTAVAGVQEALEPHPPHMTVQAKVVDGRLEFHLTYDPAALGVSALSVLDAEDIPLWRIDGGGLGTVPIIVYGQVPVEPGVRWLQQIPADGAAPAPRAGQVKVVLQWKYSGGSWVGNQRSETVVNLPDGVAPHSP
jgi:hypothetical protein